MKQLVYEIEGYLDKYNLETQEIDKIFTPIKVVIKNPTDKSIEIAKAEAYNGEYTIEDDGQPEPVAEPTAEEMFNALLGVTE